MESTESNEENPPNQVETPTVPKGQYDKLLKRTHGSELRVKSQRRQKRDWYHKFSAKSDEVKRLNGEIRTLKENAGMSEEELRRHADKQIYWDLRFAHDMMKQLYNAGHFDSTNEEGWKFEFQHGYDPYDMIGNQIFNKDGPDARICKLYKDSDDFTNMDRARTSSVHFLNYVKSEFYLRFDRKEREQQKFEKGSVDSWRAWRERNGLVAILPVSDSL